MFICKPDGAERNVEQWGDFTIKNHDFPREGVVTHMRDEYSTFGWVIERMLTEAGFTLEAADYTRRSTAPTSCASRSRTTELGK